MTVADLSPWITVPAALLLVVGALLTLVGSLGLLRLPNFYARMHPPTMGNTLGTACTLAASMLVASGLAGRPVIHEVLISLLLALTSPITSIVLMQAARHRARPE